MKTIIIIEDDETIREELEKFLSHYGYNIKSPTDFENILSFLEKEEGDLLLLDINLPIFDGYYICKEIRKNSDIPIIIVTSRDSDMDELMSINLGADDFITKPYNTQILLARISSIFKRIEGSSKNNNILTYNGLKLNLSNATIYFNDKSLELTKNEMKILYYLIENKGTIVSRDLLIENLWKTNYFIDEGTLTVNIARLRKKIEELGVKNLIETKRGLGYIIK
ncbi:response regulator transcription factor [Paraclostridium bifermentans]|uniref:response regulator transcription factor n=1 Tax=Paraclostridium bifermentans TaxID=1490 RepID=UPI001F1B450B|nr:response regulator transcription factor [Paraclostridium bifermentans]MCE9676708.1 response regulator transcription factor [Paraclostridium bifermentans]